jgi:hypothetical protein
MAFQINVCNIINQKLVLKKEKAFVYRRTEFYNRINYYFWDLTSHVADIEILHAEERCSRQHSCEASLCAMDQTYVTAGASDPSA